MTETTKMIIKIASGVAVVVIAGYKVVKARKDKKAEQPAKDEGTN